MFEDELGKVEFARRLVEHRPVDKTDGQTRAERDENQNDVNALERLPRDDVVATIESHSRCNQELKYDGQKSDDDSEMRVVDAALVQRTGMDDVIGQIDDGENENHSAVHEEDVRILIDRLEWRRAEGQLPV